MLWRIKRGSGTKLKILANAVHSVSFEATDTYCFFFLLFSKLWAFLFDHQSSSVNSHLLKQTGLPQYKDQSLD